jgi:hypothetical protein
MAIDMLENNELSALANSRVGGLKQFVDDKNLNYVGHENYVSLFGGRKKKKSAARQEIQDKYKNIATECPDISTSIETIQSDLTILVGRSNTAKGNEKLKVREQIDETTKLLGEFKSRAIKLGCGKAKEAEQEEKSKAEIQSALANYGAAAVEGAAQDIKSGAPESGSNKWLLYGGIGLGVILISVIIYKVVKK